MSGQEHTAEKDLLLPSLDRHALVCADLAWVETDGSPVERTEAAIRAYLWAVEVANREGLYPSLNQWRASVTPPGADQ